MAMKRTVIRDIIGTRCTSKALFSLLSISGLPVTWTLPFCLFTSVKKSYSPVNNRVIQRWCKFLGLFVLSCNQRYICCNWMNINWIIQCHVITFYPIELFKIYVRYNNSSKLNVVFEQSLSSESNYTETNPNTRSRLKMIKYWESQGNSPVVCIHFFVSPN